MRKKILFLLLFVLVLFTCSCGKKDEEVNKNLKSVDYKNELIGFSSKFSYDSKDKYDKFEAKIENDSSYLYFENEKLKIKYRLEVRAVTDTFIEQKDKEYKKNKKYKDIKVNDYKGYIYSGENDFNYAWITLKLKKADYFYYVLYVESSAMDKYALTDKDFVYDTVSKDEKFIKFLSSIDFKADINKYYDYMDSVDSKNK